MAVASASRMTPYERQNRNIIKQFKELRPVRIATTLFPKAAGQTKRATIVATQNEQANEHDQKQDQVGNYRRDKTEYARLGVDRVTSVLYRWARNSAKLRKR